MTGFARAEGVLAGAHEGVRWVWEARSVNGRALDVKLRLPAGFDALEPLARAGAGQRFKRGSVQAGLTLAREAQRAAPRIDLDYVAKLIAAGEPYLVAGRVSAPRWDGLLALKGVLLADEAPGEDEASRTALEGELLAGLHVALDRLLEARRSEGRMLAGVLGDLAGRLDQLIADARASAAASPQAGIERIRQRLAALAPEVQFDPQRLAQEAAMAASRADVQEELERLAAHAGELRALIASPEPAGRRLDFLAQELTREASTLCAKSGDLALTRIGLDLKAVVDQIKEQGANVE